MQMLVAQGDPNSTDISKHPEYIKGYFRAAFTSMSGDRNAYIAAGWESYRQFKSPEGNLAYHKALTGSTPKEAMKAFWAVANKAERVKKEGKIVGISSQGLTLSSGRKVDFHVAALKYKAKELCLTPEEVYRLRDMLVGKEWGKELSAQLV